MLDWLFGDKSPQEVIMRDPSATETIIWQHPSTEFNTNSRVNLLPNEIAVFYDMYNGESKIIEYSQDLKTGNIPILERFSTAMTGGISKYQCRVYFIRTSESENMRWGTPTPLGPYADSFRNGLFFKFYMNGFYSIKIVDPLKLMKLIDADKVIVFKDFMRTRVLDNLLAYITERVDCIMTTIKLDYIGYKYLILKAASALAEDIQSDVLDNYGIQLVKFKIKDMCLPEDKDDPYNKALALMAEEGALASAVDIQGMQKYLITHAVKIAELAASNNSATGAMTGIGIGTGVGAGIGGQLGGMIQSTMESLSLGNTPMVNTTPGMANINPIQGMGTSSMPQVGVVPQQHTAPAQSSTFEVSTKLEKLKQLYDCKIITEEQYNNAVQELLRSL